MYSGVRQKATVLHSKDMANSDGISVGSVNQIRGKTYQSGRTFRKFALLRVSNGGGEGVIRRGVVRVKLIGGAQLQLCRRCRVVCALRICIVAAAAPPSGSVVRFVSTPRSLSSFRNSILF